VVLDTLVALLTPVAREQIRSPADVAGVLLLEMGALTQEELRMVLLDTKNRVMGIHTVYKGSLNAAIVIAHNHSSQDCTPSPEDVLVTRSIVEAGKLLETDVLDHLIVSSNKYVSLRERGLGFT
jgi:DNA repair protein RadC